MQGCLRMKEEEKTQGNQFALITIYLMFIILVCSGEWPPVVIGRRTLLTLWFLTFAKLVLPL